MAATPIHDESQEPHTMPLTTEQARQIADAFLDAAHALDAYLDQQFNAIERAEYEFLSESFRTLLRVSAFATTTAVGLSITSMEQPAGTLTGVIQDAKQKIGALQTVGQVIQIAAALGDLGAGIMAKNAKSVLTSVGALKAVLAAEA